MSASRKHEKAKDKGAKKRTNTVRRPVCPYKTRGTIVNIDLMSKSFTIDPISPYVFEQRKEGSSEKWLFVHECGSAHATS